MYSEKHNVDIDYLKRLNPHERDNHIKFHDPSHTYTINGDSSYTSVTTWVHKHFEKFDEEKIINNMMKGKNWQPGHKYWGMTKSNISQQWEYNRQLAARKGTKLHYDIECYYNNNSVGSFDDEYGYFINFTKDYNLKPYRTEWTVFHEDIKLAGSIDMIFENPEDNGETLLIYDWKRSREITKHSPWNKFSHTESISHLPDTNYWHYCLQLNTYKTIIEQKYGKKVVEMYLVCLHPENTNKNYQRIKVVDLSKEILQLFEERKKSIKKI